MTRSLTITDHDLLPGEFQFGDRSMRIRTLLGSCVSVTLWHPTLRIGGMCHFMLPARNPQAGTLNGKYAEDAFRLFALSAQAHNTAMTEYQVKLFGGSDMFPDFGQSQHVSVSVKNVEAALKLIAHYNLNLVGQDVGATGHRNIVFEVWSGNVWVKHQSLPEQRRFT